MDVVVKSRGARITEHIRAAAQHKLSRLERIEPRVTRIEIEVISERNPRQGGTRRVEASLDTTRKTFRAHAQGTDVESALDQLAEKLERQLRDHHGKRRTRVVAGAKGVRSAAGGAAPEPEATE